MCVCVRCVYSWRWPGAKADPLGSALRAPGKTTRITSNVGTRDPGRKRLSREGRACLGKCPYCPGHPGDTGTAATVLSTTVDSCVITGPLGDAQESSVVGVLGNDAWLGHKRQVSYLPNISSAKTKWSTSAAFVEGICPVPLLDPEAASTEECQRTEAGWSLVLTHSLAKGWGCSFYVNPSTSMHTWPGRWAAYHWYAS